MAKYLVTGPFEISGVKFGGTVDLDPETTNVDALLQAGHIGPLKPNLKAKTETDKAGDA